MPCTNGAKQPTDTGRSYLLALRDNTQVSNSRNSRKRNHDEGIVRFLAKRARVAEKENIDPLTSNALQPRPRSGRSPIKSRRDARHLTHYATKNKWQRGKAWATIARELGFTCSADAINNAFKRNGFRRYPKHHKPPLSEEAKKRTQFVSDWKDKLKGKEHLIMYCDKTPMKVGEEQGQNWVTRRSDEEYHPDCIGVQFKKYSELMFWGAYTANKTEPCYIFDKESRKEKQHAQKHLEFKNIHCFLQEWFIKHNLDAKQAKKALYRPLKHCPTSHYTRGIKLPIAASIGTCHSVIFEAGKEPGKAYLIGYSVTRLRTKSLPSP